MGRKKKLTKEEWTERFAEAKTGHILWDGWAKDPYNPEHAYTSSHQFYNHAKRHGFFKTGSNILDLGCGNGRVPIALTEHPVRYVGVDPVKKSIEFCEKAFAEWPNFKFMFMDIKNESFNPEGTIDPAELTLPFPDFSFDNVICYSVFTHLQDIKVATRYIIEILRVLKEGGKLFCSWYRCPPNPLDTFVGRTVFLERDIMNLLQDFYFNETYGGTTPAYYDQWALFCTKGKLKSESDLHEVVG
jgi:SAM-dependent methyltransferase